MTMGHRKYIMTQKCVVQIPTAQWNARVLTLTAIGFKISLGYSDHWNATLRTNYFWVTRTLHKVSSTYSLMLVRSYRKSRRRSKGELPTPKRGVASRWGFRFFSPHFSNLCCRCNSSYGPASWYMFAMVLISFLGPLKCSGWLPKCGTCLLDLPDEPAGFIAGPRGCIMLYP